MRFPVSAVAAVAAAFLGVSPAAAQATKPDEQTLRLKLAQAKDALEKAQTEAAQLGSSVYRCNSGLNRVFRIG